jgi:single stranded DNA-binding protein
MYNKVILVGNLTRDIELRYTQNGSAIAKPAMSTSRRFTVNGEEKEETCFVDITFFGRSGEVAKQYLRNGSKILLEGRLSFEQWVDQTNGQSAQNTPLSSKRCKCSTLVARVVLRAVIMNTAMPEAVTAGVMMLLLKKLIILRRRILNPLR